MLIGVTMKTLGILKILCKGILQKKTKISYKLQAAITKQ